MISKTRMPRRELEKLTLPELVELSARYVEIGVDWNFYDACAGRNGERVGGKDLSFVLKAKLREMKAVV